MARPSTHPATTLQSPAADAWSRGLEIAGGDASRLEVSNGGRTVIVRNTAEQVRTTR